MGGVNDRSGVAVKIGWGEAVLDGSTVTVGVVVVAGVVVSVTIASGVREGSVVELRGGGWQLASNNSKRQINSLMA